MSKDIVFSIKDEDSDAVLNFSESIIITFNDGNSMSLSAHAFCRILKDSWEDARSKGLVYSTPLRSQS